MPGASLLHNPGKGITGQDANPAAVWHSETHGTERSSTSASPRTPSTPSTTSTSPTRCRTGRSMRAGRRRAPRPSAGSPSAAAARDEIDDIFADDEPPRGGAPSCSRCGNGGANVQVHLVTPGSFNDAQEVADHFKDAGPGDPQPADDRRRARQAADRLRLRAHLRARRRHAEDRREDLPAHPAQRRGLAPRRRRGSSKRASSTSHNNCPAMLRSRRLACGYAAGMSCATASLAGV